MVEWHPSAVRFRARLRGTGRAERSPGFCLRPLQVRAVVGPALGTASPRGLRALLPEEIVLGMLHRTHRGLAEGNGVPAEGLRDKLWIASSSNRVVSLIGVSLLQNDHPCRVALPKLNLEF